MHENKSSGPQSVHEVDALRLRVAQSRVVEALLSSLPLLLVQVGGKILRDEPIEEHPEHIALEVPAIHAAAEIVGDAPDGLVDLCALGFPGVVHAEGCRTVRIGDSNRRNATPILSQSQATEARWCSLASGPQALSRGWPRCVG